MDNTAQEAHTPRMSVKLLMYFWPHVKPDWGKLSLSFLGLTLQAAFSVLITMVPALLERNWSAASRNTLFLAIGGLLAINLVIMAVQSGVNWMMTNVTENVVRRVKLAIFKKVGSLPTEEMSFQVVGKFAQRTTGDVMRLGGLVSPGIPMAVFSLLQLIFMMTALFWLDARFAWTVPVAVVIIWVSLQKINERARYWARKDQLAQEQILTHFIESIGGIRDLVASGRFDNAADLYNEELAKKQRFLISSANWNNLAGVLPTALFSMLIFGYYLWRIAESDFSGKSEIGTMLTFAGNLLMAQGLVLTVFKLLTEAELGAPSLYELQRLLSAPEVKDPGLEDAIPSNEIIFDNVSFAYGNAAASLKRRKEVSARFQQMRSSAHQKLPDRPKENGAEPSKKGDKADALNESQIIAKPILDRVTFKIEPGKFAAIVGQSGSGKTTLFYMLLRLLEPHDGDILLGGVPLGDIPLKMLRDYIGFIPQAPFIFSGSIKQNLLMGANEADVSDEKIQRAVEMANLGGLINKRKRDGGINAPVGAGGASLSAGERQRLALARVFLRDPGLIVCDEYTANIDNATAKLIQNALKNEFAGKTRIVITHQLYTVRGADCIYVLDEGKIVQHGTHESLMENPGLYRDMWEVQRV